LFFDHFFRALQNHAVDGFHLPGHRETALALRKESTQAKPQTLVLLTAVSRSNLATQESAQTSLGLLLFRQCVGQFAEASITIAGSFSDQNYSSCQRMHTQESIDEG